MNVIDDVFFEDHHRKILPVVVLRKRLKEKMMQKAGVKLKKFTEKLTFEEAYEKLKSQDPGLSETTKALNKYCLEALEGGERLGGAVNRPSIKRMMKSQILRNQGSMSFSPLLRGSSGQFSSNKVHPYEEDGKKIELRELSEARKLISQKKKKMELEFLK